MYMYMYMYGLFNETCTGLMTLASRLVAFSRSFGRARKKDRSSDERNFSRNTFTGTVNSHQPETSQSQIEYSKCTDVPNPVHSISQSFPPQSAATTRAIVPVPVQAIAPIHSLVALFSW
eukprot:COSAG02_NODE_2175_length_9589_cov_6.644573_2_plen_119_part_00